MKIEIIEKQIRLKGIGIHYKPGEGGGHWNPHLSIDTGDIKAIQESSSLGKIVACTPHCMLITEY